jgi:hypothetical protein
MLDPEASALVFHHPDCSYLSVGESPEILIISFKQRIENVCLWIKALNGYPMTPVIISVG